MSNPFYYGNFAAGDGEPHESAFHSSPHSNLGVGHSSSSIPTLGQALEKGIATYDMPGQFDAFNFEALYQVAQAQQQVTSQDTILQSSSQTSSKAGKSSTKSSSRSTAASSGAAAASSPGSSSGNHKKSSKPKSKREKSSHSTHSGSSSSSGYTTPPHVSMANSTTAATLIASFPNPPELTPPEPPLVLSSSNDTINWDEGDLYGHTFCPGVYAQLFPTLSAATADAVRMAVASMAVEILCDLLHVDAPPIAPLDPANAALLAHVSSSAAAAATAVATSPLANGGSTAGVSSTVPRSDASTVLPHGTFNSPTALAGAPGAAAPQINAESVSVLASAAASATLEGAAPAALVQHLDRVLLSGSVEEQEQELIQVLSSPSASTSARYLAALSGESVPISDRTAITQLPPGTQDKLCVVSHSLAVLALSPEEWLGGIRIRDDSDDDDDDEDDEDDEETAGELGVIPEEGDHKAEGQATSDVRCHLSPEEDSKTNHQSTRCELETSLTTSADTTPESGPSSGASEDSAKSKKELRKAKRRQEKELVEGRRTRLRLTQAELERAVECLEALCEVLLERRKVLLSRADMLQQAQIRESAAWARVCEGQRRRLTDLLRMKKDEEAQAALQSQATAQALQQAVNAVRDAEQLRLPPAKIQKLDKARDLLALKHGEKLAVLDTLAQEAAALQNQCSAITLLLLELCKDPAKRSYSHMERVVKTDWALKTLGVKYRDLLAAKIEDLSRLRSEAVILRHRAEAVALAHRALRIRLAHLVSHAWK